jgi:hypothetical protein
MTRRETTAIGTPDLGGREARPGAPFAAGGRFTFVTSPRYGWWRLARG